MLHSIVIPEVPPSSDTCEPLSTVHCALCSALPCSALHSCLPVRQCKCVARFSSNIRFGSPSSFSAYHPGIAAADTSPPDSPSLLKPLELYRGSRVPIILELAAKMDTKVANNVHSVKVEPIGESKSVSSSPAVKKQVAVRPGQENAGSVAPAKVAAPRVEGRKTIKAQARASQAESAVKAAEKARAAAKAAANAASEALKDASGANSEPRKRSASLNIDGESINSNTRRKSMDDFCTSNPRNDSSLLDGVESAVLEGCEIAGWPDFSLDSLDAGEIDDISPGLSLPELERSSEKDGSGEAEPSSSEAQQTPSSASCKEETQKDQKDVSTSSGGKTAQAARRKGKVSRA